MPRADRVIGPSVCPGQTSHAPLVSRARFEIKALTDPPARAAFTGVLDQKSRLVSLLTDLITR